MSVSAATKARPGGADQLLKRMKRLSRARRRFSDFAHFVGRDKQGKAFVERPDTRLLCDAMEHAWKSQRSLSVVASPGMAKSTMGRLFLMWLLGRDASLSTVVTSADRSVSRNMVSLCRSIVLANPDYADTFAEVMPDEERSRVGRGWRMDEFFLRRPEGAQTADPSVKAMAAEPKAEALRVDLLLADDMMTGKVARSDALRSAMKEAFQGTWRGRLTNSRGPGLDGIFVTLSNCWHRSDLGHDLLKDERCASLWIGVAPGNRKLFARLVNPLPDHPLLKTPERYEAELVKESDSGKEFIFHLPMAGALDPASLDAEERATPEDYRRSRRLMAPDESSVMFPGWRAAYRPGLNVAQLLGPGAGLDAAGKLFIHPDCRREFVVGWGFDMAGQHRPGDALAVCVSPLARQDIVLGALFKGNWGLDEIASLFDTLCAAGLDPDLAYLENNGVQSKLVKALQRHNSGNLWRKKLAGFCTGSNKMDPTGGLPDLALDLRRERCVWPGGMADLGNAMAERYRAMEGILDHCPRVLGPGESPDELMAFWLAWSAANLILRRRAGHSKSGGSFDMSGLGSL
jgi:hypothetical protein